MWDSLSFYYSSSGPAGAWTPFLAVLLNLLGVILALALTKGLPLLFKPTYDLRKLPSPPVGDLILGHAKSLLRPDYHRVILDWTRKYGSIFRLRILTQWTVVITDPWVAAQVLATVPRRTHNYSLVDEVLGGPGKVSMFGTLDEAHWRNVRKTTAPAFSMTNVRRYYGGVLSAAGELLTSLERHLDQNLDRDRHQLEAYGGGGCCWVVDVEAPLQRMMLRATLEGLFEVPDARDLPGFDLLAPRILSLMAEANRQITDPIRAAWFRSPLAPLMSKHVAECRRATREVVAFHTRTAARLLARPDPSPDNTLLWACLHRLRHPTTGRKLSPTQLHPEVGMYTTAGFDTTASTVGWCLYAASLHPQQQERVAAELRAAGVFGRGAVVPEQREEEREAQEARGRGRAAEPSEAAGGGKGRGTGGAVRLDPRVAPGPDELARLPLLNAFINETMRLYPSTAVSAERTSPDHPVRLGGLTLPPGVVLWPLVYGLHMSEDNWEQPEEFRLERWLDDPHCALARPTGDRVVSEQQPGQSRQRQGQAGRVPGPGPAAEEGPAPRRFMPFGEGPKNCVGQNFGITVVRATVALLLSRYRVALHPDMGVGPAAAAAAAEGEGKGSGISSSCNGGSGSLAARTAALTRVAVVTKLARLRLVLSRREGEGEGDEA
ncbi:hypothetical protein PLESTB_000580500 [Pleodorina starrii]|uniref:Cytochrome P450 n=1 Tax=Pleodorina starrii TaxID=330485 RepID=A0A9W6F0V8_9CHLO|nr:hypothetical protein PLESTM_000303900 [Pleodorina starrii]GLC52079.1 hypothetical protein PLESTB_000580500 [Pleodorina starrii]GLC72222.1 hypothetical protein PLESTF_001220700 [Pleodorina starrii]